MAVPTDITVAVSNALAQQPWFVRRKDTLTALAGGVLQLANVVAVIGTDWPWWAGVIVALAVSAAETIIHAGTPGAFTPSMAERLEQTAPRAGEHRPETYTEARDRLAQENDDDVTIGDVIQSFDNVHQAIERA